MKKNKVIFISCWHDRHTDDKYRAFTKEESAKNQCRKWMSEWKTYEENLQFGDWCLYVSDDYYSFVQKITVDEVDK